MATDGKNLNTPPPVPVVPGPAPSLAENKKKVFPVPPAPLPSTEHNPLGEKGSAGTISIGNAPTSASMPVPTETGENHNPQHSTAQTSAKKDKKHKKKHHRHKKQ
jgi:hypothetical protein